MDRKSQFNLIKPYSTAVMARFSLVNLKQYKAQLKILMEQDETSDQFVEYLAFPLIMNLKKEMQASKAIKEEVMEEAFTCLAIILKDQHELSWSFIQDVFIQLFICLSSAEDPQQVAKYSESCLHQGILCVKYLCSALKNEDLDSYCSREFKPKLGHGIFISLKMAEQTGSVTLKVSALDTLKALGLHHLVLLTKDENNMISETLRYFLPGVSMASTKIAASKAVQNHKITVASLQCWTHYISMSMSDSSLMTHFENLGKNTSQIQLLDSLVPKSGKVEQSNLDHKLQEEKASGLPPIVLNRSWLEITQLKIVRLFDSLQSLVLHPHWKVRLTLAELCQTMLIKCRMSLSSLMVELFEVLITLSNDPSDDVSTVAQDGLKCLSHSLSDEEYEEIVYSLMDKTHVLVIKLITISQSYEEDKLLESLQNLLGNFQIFGSKVTQYFEVPGRLEKLIYSLSVVLSLSTADPDIMYENLLNTDCYESVCHFKVDVNRSFMYFRNKRVLEIVRKICSSIALHCDVMLLSDEFLHKISQRNSYQKETALFLLYLIEEFKGHELLDSTKQIFASNILDAIHEHNFLNINITGTQNSMDTSISGDRADVLFISNILDVIGASAVLLKSNFKKYLNAYLYPIMEKAGQPNALISYSSICALKLIAEACECPGIPDLIEKNVPFFWFPLSQKLKIITEYPSAPYVLSFALRTKYDGVRTYVEDLVEDTLDSLDMFHSEMSVSLFKVFLVFVNSLRSKLPLGHTNVETHSNEPSFWVKVRDVDANYRAILESSSECDTEVTEPLTEKHFERSEGQSAPPEETVDNAPRHIKLVSGIVERCSFTMSTDDREVRLLCLEIVRSCVSVLLNYENTKLPVYHKLWKPLMFCLKGHDWVVWARCVETCVMMLESSGDFLHKRVLEQFLPPLIQFLNNNHTASAGKSSNDAFFISHVYKAQQLVLEKLLAVLQCMELNPEHATNLLQTILLYADVQQPPTLISLVTYLLHFYKTHYLEVLWLGLTISLLVNSQKEDSPISAKIRVKNHQRLHPSVIMFYETL